MFILQISTLAECSTGFNRIQPKIEIIQGVWTSLLNFFIVFISISLRRFIATL